MKEGSMKNGWKLASRDQGLFTRQQLHTAPIRTASPNAPIAPSWKESKRLLQTQSLIKGYGWKLPIQSFISKIAAQQVQSQLHHTSSGTESNQISPISELLVQQRIFMFQRKSALNSILTHTKEL